MKTLLLLALAACAPRLPASTPVADDDTGHAVAKLPTERARADVRTPYGMKANIRTDAGRIWR